MGKEYIVSTESGKLYRFFLRIPLPFYCLGNSDISVHSAVKYSDARKFRSLLWATHRAKYLSKHSGSLYYVYTIVNKVDGTCLMKKVDDSINDKLIKRRKQFEDDIDAVINNWKAKRNIKTKKGEL